MGERRSITAAVVTMVAGTLPVFLVGALGPQLRADLGFGRSALGAAIAVCQTTAAMAAWVLGRRVIAHGPARAVRASAVASAIALAGIAALATNWLTLAPFLVACGLANAIGQPATNALLSAEVAAPRRGRSFGIKMAAVPLGSLLAGVLVPVVAVPFGWRATVAVGTLLPLLALTLTRARGARPVVMPQLPAPDTSGSVLVLLGIGSGLVIAATNSVPSFFVDAAIDAGTSEAVAGLSLAAGGLSGVAVRLAIGRAVDRRRRTSLDMVVAMVLTGSVGFALLAAAHPLAQLAGVVLVFGLGWGWVGLFQYLLVAVNPTNPGSATGVTDTGGYIGAAIGPIAAGVIADRASFTATWSVAAAAMTVGAGFLHAGSRLARRRGSPLELRADMGAAAPAT